MYSQSLEPSYSAHRQKEKEKKLAWHGTEDLRSHVALVIDYPEAHGKDPKSSPELCTLLMKHLVKYCKGTGGGSLS